MPRLLYWLQLLCLTGVLASDYNIVNLDNATFSLIIGRSYPVFLRIDKEYPYGAKADAFKNMAAVVGKSGNKVIIASIGVSTYGDKQNMDMVRKLSLMPDGKDDLESADMDKSFPKFMHFKAGDSEGSHYTGAVTKAAMLKFLGIEEKTCDFLTSEFCNEEERTHIKFFEGTSMDELNAELKVLTKRSGQVLKKEERVVVDGRLRVLKKLVKAHKKAAKQAKQKK